MKKKKEKIVITKGKRKRAVARVRIKKGKGKVIFNNTPLDLVEDKTVKYIVSEPFKFCAPSEFDILIRTNGGGKMGQAQAARTAIAKALVEFTGDATLKKRLLEYDRAMLVDDMRRVEPKKYLGRKARARFTKSYR